MDQPAELAPQDLATATALPAHYYVDAAMAARDRASIFDAAWQLVAHVSQLRGSGDHVIVFLPRKRMVRQIEKLFQVGATFF